MRLSLFSATIVLATLTSSVAWSQPEQKLPSGLPFPAPSARTIDTAEQSHMPAGVTQPTKAATAISAPVAATTAVKPHTVGMQPVYSYGANVPKSKPRPSLIKVKKSKRLSPAAKKQKTPKTIVDETMGTASVDTTVVPSKEKAIEKASPDMGVSGMQVPVIPTEKVDLPATGDAAATSSPAVMPAEQANTAPEGHVQPPEDILDFSATPDSSAPPAGVDAPAPSAEMPH